MTSYYCCVLRYVHNMFTHEFVNVGLMMWIPQDEQIIFDATIRYERISQFFDNFDGRIYRQRIYDLRELSRKLYRDLSALQRYKEDPSEVFYELLPKGLSCFQWSSPIAGICSKPEERFDELFNKYVGVYKPNTPTEADIIWHTVRSELKKHDLNKHVQFDFTMKAANVDWPFKMSWDNGIRQVLEPIPLTFQRPAKIIDNANIWSGRLDLLAKDHNFNCTAVISNNPTGQNTDAYYEAYAILENAPSMRKIITKNQMPNYIPEIKQDLHIENR